MHINYFILAFAISYSIICGKRKWKIIQSFAEFLFYFYITYFNNIFSNLMCYYFTNQN